jgi:hypothetical protein
MTAPIDVLYIAGSGRSGSTLLDRVLGQSPELTSLGEMRYLWTFGLTDNNLCECGEPFRDCAFWQRVLRESLGDLDPVKIERLKRIANRLDWVPSIPRVIGWVPGGRWERDELVDTLSRVYRAISGAAGTPWLVDSSKAPSYGFLISRSAEIRLHVLHLIRDPRAVANSWQRKRRRPEITSGTVYMPRRFTLLTALRWNYGNLLDQALGRRAAGYTRLRYEDFVSAPVDSVARIRDAIGLDPASSDSVSDDAVNMKRSHTLAGNPNRFQTGVIRFKLDDGWRAELAPGAFGLVTAVTLPLLRFYGYRASRRPREEPGG